MNKLTVGERENAGFTAREQAVFVDDRVAAVVAQASRKGRIHVYVAGQVWNRVVYPTWKVALDTAMKIVGEGMFC